MRSRICPFIRQICLILCDVLVVIVEVEGNICIGIS